MSTAKLAHGAGECDMRQRQGERDISFADNCIPPIYSSRTPFKVLDMMFKHPLTKIGFDQFMADLGSDETLQQ